MPEQPSMVEHYLAKSRVEVPLCLCSLALSSYDPFRLDSVFLEVHWLGCTLSFMVCTSWRMYLFITINLFGDSDVWPLTDFLFLLFVIASTLGFVLLFSYFLPSLVERALGWERVWSVSLTICIDHLKFSFFVYTMVSKVSY
jgi:hypothetical protein